VLVVDDQAVLRLLYRLNLELEGISVVEAADGRSGLKCAARDSPDLILLDTEMPGLLGWQVAAALRADDATRAIPFVFVTARAKYRDRLRGLELGAVDYITLPTNPLTLPAHVRWLLEQTPEEREALRHQRLTEVRAANAADPDDPTIPLPLRSAAIDGADDATVANVGSVFRGGAEEIQGRAPGCSLRASRRKKNRCFAAALWS
jgi:DNA-binding response OmpR family regulator